VDRGADKTNPAIEGNVEIRTEKAASQTKELGAPSDQPVKIRELSPAAAPAGLSQI
jgi:hypothetical protein